MGVRHILIALTLACVPSVAAADSDGYFCSAPGMLAFDAITGGGVGRTIHIIRFDPLAGIQPAERVEITDDIQTHAIICKANGVEIYSWDHVYVIDTSVPGVPKLATKQASRVGRTAPASANLEGTRNQSAIVVLQANAEDDQFELVIAHVQVKRKGLGLDTYTSTDLVHRVGREIRAQQRLLFKVFRETAN